MFRLLPSLLTRSANSSRGSFNQVKYYYYGSQPFSTGSHDDFSAQKRKIDGDEEALQLIKVNCPCF